MACSGSALYLWTEYRRRSGVRPRPPRGQTQLNLLRPAGLPAFESKGPGSIPGSRGVRIWPRLGKQGFVCIGREAEFQALRARNTHFPPWGASNKNKNKMCYVSFLKPNLLLEYQIKRTTFIKNFYILIILNKMCHIFAD